MPFSPAATGRESAALRQNTLNTNFPPGAQHADLPTF
jgi:hypothetical protein